MCRESGYVFCDCNHNKGLSDSPAQNGQPAAKNETQKDIQEEAQKYSNTEVPTHNKVFAGTLLIVTLMIVNGVN